ncbi:HNH endonuclease signature motif containing protein, partial [Nocardioides panacisoli]|uniref:HNH endonuclease signature motif containing protein n=1 Tax=Nocardioides panacisoli TaxID=627624 RepID=UPI0031D3AD42
EIPWDQVEGPDAIEIAAGLGKLKALIDGALVALAERIEATDATRPTGWASTKDYLTHVLGGRKGAGAAYLRVAKQTAELPEVRQALAAGEISLAQAGVIGGRVATLPHAPELRETAATTMLTQVAEKAFDATDLDRGFTEVIKELDPDGSLLRADAEKENAERGAHNARYLTFAPDTLGGARIKGYGSLEDIEIIKTVLMPLSAPITTQPGACGGDPDRFHNRDAQGRPVGGSCPDPNCWHDGKDPREAGARMFDALLDACTRLQATDDLPKAHGTTARILITTSYEDLKQQLHEQATAADPGLLPSGDTLSPAAVRRLACDAEIIPAVLGTPSQILDIGRAQRLITTAIWLALLLRDQHCAFPACTRHAIACEAHHIHHWADGGTTSLDNLVLLCRHHHTITHHTPWTVTIDPHTRRPTWTPPPTTHDTTRWSYRPG